MTPTIEPISDAAVRLSYATPQASHSGPRLTAGVWIGLIGLALVLLGGCFLIGVMGLVSPSSMGFNKTTVPASLTSSQLTLLIILYALAFASIFGAVVLLVMSVRILLKSALGQAL